MKIPPSSSLLLATLAISSSSSTLAAPAGESDIAVTTSSNHHISALLSSSGADLASADIDIEQRTSTTAERSEVDSEAQGQKVSALLGLLHNLPIIGHPFASLIEKSFPIHTASVSGTPDISPDDLNALQAAIAEVSRALSQPAPSIASAVQSVNGTSPTAMSNGDASNTDSSVSNGFSGTPAVIADPTNTASSLSHLSAAATDGSTTMDEVTSTLTPSQSTSFPQSSSPTIPGNPPNSPAA